MNGRALFTFNPTLFEEADQIDEVKEADREESKQDDKVDQELFANEQVNEDEDVDFDD